MVTAELSHNPYLLLTSARFNGHAPRINSPIEKFEERPLVEWVQEVPRIFHDEMNGYDFDFAFTGTDTDYEKLLGAFESQGIGPKDVRITRRGQLEDVDTKKREIAELIEWLNRHRNRRFDFSAFRSANSEALDSTMPFVVIQDDPLHIELPFADVEIVGSAYDLASTNLTNTPVLITVDRTNRSVFRKELQYLLDRPDIKQRQLFILIHPAINKERAIRVITDLGVHDPQVVDGPDDARILAYLNDYPAMEYTRTAISVLRETLNGLKDAFEKVNRFGMATNAGVRDEIGVLEKRLDLLKDSLARIQDDDFFSPPQTFEGPSNLLEGQIVTWHNKKSSVSGHDQIVRTALDYAADLQTFVHSYELNIGSLMESAELAIEQSLTDIYEASGARPLQPSETTFQINQARFVFPDIAVMLGELTETSYASPRNDFFGLFATMGETSAEKTPIEVANLEIWRSLARKTLMPLAQEYEKKCHEILDEYRDSLIQTYVHQLQDAIDECLAAKEKATSRLSTAARRMQEDNDWLDEFEDRLHAIERD